METTGAGSVAAGTAAAAAGAEVAANASARSYSRRGRPRADRGVTTITTDRLTVIAAICRIAIVPGAVTVIRRRVVAIVRALLSSIVEAVVMPAPPAAIRRHRTWSTFPWSSEGIRTTI
jgi:hypothetical protein